MMYDYTVIHGDIYHVEHELNTYGILGWKVVAASWDADAHEHVVYLIREE